MKVKGINKIKDNSSFNKPIHLCNKQENLKVCFPSLLRNENMILKMFQIRRLFYKIQKTEPYEMHAIYGSHTSSGHETDFNIATNHRCIIKILNFGKRLCLKFNRPWKKTEEM